MSSPTPNLDGQTQREQRIGILPGTSVKWVMAALMIGTLLSTLDMTIVSTAMPRIVDELGEFSRYSWVFTAYMLTSTIFMPVYGKLSDLFGRKPLYLIGVGLFVLGSLLSGFAHNMTELILFRGLQGIGGASLAPIAMAVTGDLFPPSDRLKMQGLFAAVFGLGSIAGPAIGGFMTGYLSWSWVFWLNVPIGLAGMLIVALALKEAPRHEKVPVDVTGSVLLLTGLTALLLALNIGGVSVPWNSWAIRGLFSISFVVLAAFVFVETRAKEPIIPLKLFTAKSSAVAYFVIFLMGGAIFGAVSFIPLYMQGVKGLSAAKAGTILTPAMFGVIVTSLLSIPLAKKVGEKPVVIVSLLLFGLGYFLLGRLQPGTSLWVPYVDGVILGLGIGGSQSLLYTFIQNTAPAAFRGIAVSLAEFFNIIGGSIGVTLMGLVLNHTLTDRLQQLAKQFPAMQSTGSAPNLNSVQDLQVLQAPGAASHGGPALLDGIRDALSHSIQAAFLLALFVVIVTCVVWVLLGGSGSKTNASTHSDPVH